jgi:thiol-disulfide isomerase/thioredoxin
MPCRWVCHIASNSPVNNVKPLNEYPSSRPGTLIAASLLALVLALPAWAGDWSLKDSYGTRYTLSGLHGKWVLVNFWAPWCPPCLDEMPGLVTLQQKHKDLQVIGVAVAYGSRKEVSDIVSRLSISYPIVFGNEDTAGDFGGLNGMPTSFLYAPDGRLVGNHQGPLTLSEVEHAIEQNPQAAALFTN